MRASVLFCCAILCGSLALHAQGDIRVQEDITPMLNAVETDPKDFSANYNLANYYYQKGITTLENVPAKCPADEMRRIQASAQDYFKKALPFATQCHEMDERNILVLRMLSGIYMGLANMEESDHYRQLSEQHTVH